MLKSWMGLLAATLLVAATGCGSSDDTVYGKVTANGKDIEEGFISFMPTDGQNSTYGAPIENGKYRAKVKPGSYTVTVSGGAKGKGFPKSQEDLMKMSDKDLEPPEQVPPDAKGNNQKLEVKPGSQEHNFTLEYPPARKER
jgi:hypothetical protein